jgi:glycerol-3-phosphate acyltransferase PlsX
MGGDHAPAAVVAGVELALARDPALAIALVGPEEALSGLAPTPRLTLVPSGPGVPDGGHPAAFLRRHPDASLCRAVDLVARGEADGVVSVGHTGALMIAARWLLGTLPGVRRPAPAAVFPLGSRPVVLDIGANTEVEAQDLLALAALGSAYARVVRGTPHPRVGLIANGTEPEKGTPLLREAHRLFLHRAERFVGFVEPVDMFSDAADVLVADGFVGNIVLKTMEGAARALLPLLPPGAEELRRVLERATDITASGSPPLLLGTSGLVMPGHGRARAEDVARVIALAAEAVEQRIVPAELECLRRFGLGDDADGEGKGSA